MKQNLLKEQFLIDEINHIIDSGANYLRFMNLFRDYKEQLLFSLNNQVTTPIIEEPILIGYLNKTMGWVGYEKCIEGTPVFEYKGLYQIESVNLNKNLPNRIVTFYKENLKRSINLI